MRCYPDLTLLMTLKGPLDVQASLEENRSLALEWVWTNYRVIVPGTNLALETIGTYLFGKRFASDENWWWIRTGAMTVLLTGIAAGSAYAGAEFGKLYADAVAGGKWPPGFWPPMG